MQGIHVARRSGSRTRTLAHVSDLHLGRSSRDEANAAQLCRALVEIGIDHVIATGDLTHRGRAQELAMFERAFAPLTAAGALTVVPGNHDRLGDDLGDAIMPGARVQVALAEGLAVVRVNSTAEHNRSWIAGHGALEPDDLEAVDAALDSIPAGHMVVLALHHHVLPLPDEHAMERLSSFLGWPFTAELTRGRELLARLQGRCPLVLHGHRHIPRGVHVDGDRGTVRVYNAGSSTLLGGIRIFEHADGALVNGPWWLQAAPTPDGVAPFAAAPEAYAVETTQQVLAAG
jgi:3',5'-cyclic AMP phosphodiesterase CpdA